MYVTGGDSRAVSSLVWVSRDGTEEPLDAEPGEYGSVRVSPDGVHLALDRDGDVWTFDTTRGTFNRVTTDPGADWNPIWTPDWQRLVFESERGGRSEIFWTLADGTGTPQRITSAEGSFFATPEALTPDGKTVLFNQVTTAGSRANIAMVPLEGDATAELLIEDEFLTVAPAVSPDGRWVAYMSDLSGNVEIYVQRFPSLGNRQLVSRGGGTFPRWSPDGTELFYKSLDGRRMFAVPVVSEPVFTTGLPELLFEGPYLGAFERSRPYDVHPEGDRFVMVRSSGGTDAQPQIILVENWTEELTRLVPTP